MGKTYVDTVKYVVHAQIEIDGIVEKPDVVGAIFGQTEGLLGEELDLRELQKSGRIGRIEVNIKDEKGKSAGEIILPSSLDRVETAIIAAALETVDRVGPCEAKVNVKSIQDMRTQKRTHVVDRAQNILKEMIQGKTPESKEISEKVRDEVKQAEVCSYGPEKLACGPDIHENNEIIIVEGRADVLNLLRSDIKNVIALQGKNIPKSVADLTKQKTATVFVDGDRGGDLILKQMEENCEVDYVTKAPDGKEVEELTKKEILKALRTKIAYDQFMNKTFNERTETKAPRTYTRSSPRASTSTTRSTSQRPRRPRAEHSERRSYPQRRISSRGPYRTSRPSAARTSTRPKTPNPYESSLKKLSGTLKGVILDKEGKTLTETEVRNLPQEIEKNQGAEAVVFDGIITQRLVDIANQKNINYLVGVKQTRINNNGKVKVISES